MRARSSTAANSCVLTRAASAQMVLERVRAVGRGPITAPSRFGLAPVLRAHDRQFVEFLRNAWADWVAAGNRGEAIPDCWPARRIAQRRPNGIAGRLGYYAMAGETSISAGTWEAASAAVDVALSGASGLRDGARAAFALCRPAWRSTGSISLLLRLCR